MSSLRNSLHRRNHKERSQLAHRSKFGILEKHKDYVLRARDYHAKQDKITRLRQKASDRNKDEFYFGMTRERTQGGVHIQERGNAALPADIVKVLKTQDENYLRTMRSSGLKKIDKLKGQLSALADLLRPGSLEDDRDGQEDLDEADLEVLREAGVIAAPASSRRRRKSGSGRRAQHLVFAENEDEARQFASTSKEKGHPQSEDVDMMTHTEVPVDLGWRNPEDTKQSKKRSSATQKAENPLDTKALIAERRKAAEEHRTQLLKELSARLTRDKQLRYAEREVEMQRLLMAKGASKKIAGVEKVGDDDESDSEDAGSRRKKVDEKTWKPRVYKWRLERKK